MMRVWAAVALAAFLAAPLAAQGEEGKAQKPAKKEKRICRAAEPTGSRLVVRTCHTETEWAAIDREQAQHAKEELHRQQMMANSEGSGFSGN